MKSLGWSDESTPEARESLSVAEALLMYQRAGMPWIDAWDSGGGKILIGSAGPDAWAWDISRPLADQLAETARDDAAADALTELDDQADIEEARAAANTAALVADLDVKGPAYDAINDAFDASDADEPGGSP